MKSHHITIHRASRYSLLLLLIITASGCVHDEEAYWRQQHQLSREAFNTPPSGPSINQLAPSSKPPEFHLPHMK